jgi:hypothetical protein
LLPFGPYFYAWGQLIGSSKALDDSERAEILSALLNTHLRRTDEHGCLRAIAGMNRVLDGGVEALANLLPQEGRQALLRPPVKSALRVGEKEFLKTFHSGLKRG